MFLNNNIYIEILNNGNCKGCALPLYGTRRKFCSTKCNTKYKNQEYKKLHPKPRGVEGPRCCVNCTVQFFKSHSGLLNYCSDSCKKQNQYKGNKNPFTKTNIRENRTGVPKATLNNQTACAYDEAVIDNDILDHIEYLCNDDEPYVQEDLEWLERVLSEEQTKAFYEDGTPYKPDPLSWELRKTPSSWWWKEPNRAIRRKRGWWTRQYFGTLNERATKMRLRKMKYGERKKFMALVKS